MAALRFIHLRLHTEYSLLEGAIPVKKLPQMCINADMPAVAVTDTNNMFCALEFSEGAAKAGVQPIIGCQIDLAYDQRRTGTARKAARPIGFAGSERDRLCKPDEAELVRVYRRGRALPQVTLDELETIFGWFDLSVWWPDGPVGQLSAARARPQGARR